MQLHQAELTAEVCSGSFCRQPNLQLPHSRPSVSLAVWTLGNVDGLHNLSSSYVNMEDSPLVHSPYQNPVVCGCAGLGERRSCTTLRKMAMLAGLIPRSYLMGAAQIEGDRCGYLIALFLGTKQIATEPSL